MGRRLSWEKSTMQKKMRDQGSVDGRFSVEMKRISRIHEETRAKGLTAKEIRSLHYILTGEKI